MVSLLARSGYYMAYCAPSDMTDFDNNQAAIVEAELNAMDWFISAEIQHTKPRTFNVNPLSATYIPSRINAGRYLGQLSSTHYLQTGILSYMVKGVSSTSGAGPYTTTITADTDTAPPSLGFHYEKEGGTAARRRDIMGFVGTGLDITVSERNPIATQTLTGQFAYTGAGSDLAKPTALTQASYAPYTWYNYKSSSGASAFTYGGGAIDVDIVELKIHLGWKEALFTTYDASGYPTDGHHTPPITDYIQVGCRVQDAGNTALDTISDLVLSATPAYAGGDLDMTIDFYESASRGLKYAYDKLYVVPDSYAEIFQDEGNWYDGVTFTLAYLSSGSSCTITDITAGLDKTYYGNTP